jgi:K+-transporting ATPase ATPase C chain
MRKVKDMLLRPLIAILVFSALLGLAYPLAVTGAAQVLFPGKADGSRIELDGRVVGSALIGQDFGGKPRYFQSRPSATEYSANVTFFNNLGPNNRELSGFFDEQLAAYLERERPYNPGLTRANVPVDAVTTSASGVDPHISQANARIQARRVAAVRGLDLGRVLELIDGHTDGRGLGLLGEPGVNVLELNIALDRESREEPRR